jgi:NtrC-family two-component system sensor histidine kinase KinB
MYILIVFFSVTLLLLAATLVILVRSNLQKRVEELRALNAVGQAISASLALPDLLETIHQQTAQLMAAQDFYIAFYDPQKEQLSFPLVIEDGQRVTWEPRPCGNGLADYVIHNRVPLLMKKDEQKKRAALGLEECRRPPACWLGVPLIVGDRALGAIAVQSFERADAYNARHLGMLTTIASQAAVAIENAQLYSRTDAALAEQLEQLSAKNEELARLLEENTRLFNEAQRRVAELFTVQQVGLQIVSHLELKEVLAAVAESTLNLIAADEVYIFLYDAARDELEFATSLWASGERDLLVAPPRPDGLTAAVARQGERVVVDDVDQHPLFHREEEVRVWGIKAIAGFPLKRGAEVIGLFSVAFRQPHKFEEDELRLLELLGTQVAIAISNARLFEEAQRRLREQSLLMAANASISSTFDINEVLRVMAAQIAEAAGVESCDILDWNEAAGTMTRLLEYSWEPGMPQGTGIVYNVRGQPASRRVAQTREPLLVYADDPLADAAERRTLEVLRRAGLLILPMIARDQVVGLVKLMDRQKRDFDAATIQLCQILANQTAIALVNARLFQQVAEGRDRSAAILNSTREGILMLDTTGRIIMANPMVEKLWGVQRADLLDVRVGERESAAWPAHVIETLTTTLQELRSQPEAEYRAEMKTPDRRARVVECQGIPVKDEIGAVMGWVIILRDMTEERELAQMREDLSQMIVHDLRSPLAAILGALYTMDEWVDAGQRECKPLLRIATYSTQRMMSLVDSLLDIAALEAEQMPLQRRAVDLGEAVRTVVDRLKPLIIQENLAIDVELPASALSVNADEDVLGRVLLNLLDNAVKFTPRGRGVLIAARALEVKDGLLLAPGDERGGERLPAGMPPLPEGRWAQVSVADSGPGVPVAQREHLFEKFGQLRDRQGRRRGTGLGLAFCKLAVEAHGGRIWVEGEEEQGSTFVFVLPAA